MRRALREILSWGLMRGIAPEARWGPEPPFERGFGAGCNGALFGGRGSTDPGTSA